MIITPPCTPYGPLARINEWANPESHQLSLRYHHPISKLCGELALYQLEHGFDFLSEQPQGSTLYNIKPWPAVAGHVRAVKCIVHQCMAGQVDKHELPVQKPTEVWASDPILLKPLLPLVCTHQPHEHGCVHTDLCKGIPTTHPVLLDYIKQ